MPKSWLEKYNTTTKHKVKIIEKRFADLPAGTHMLIATPKILDTYIKSIPFGCFVNIKTMRTDIALEHLAENTCPVTTSIFLRVVAEIALEQFNNGTPITAITPFWRVINTKMPIAKKLSCNLDFITLQHKNENINNG